MIIYEDRLKALLEGPEIAGLWHNTLDKMREKANELAQTENAAYGSAVHEPDSEWADVFGVGGFVYTANYEARIDEEYHNTLVHVLGLMDSLIAEAADLGGGMTYDSRGKGSTVRGKDGRFAPMGEVSRGQRNRGTESED